MGLPKAMYVLWAALVLGRVSCSPPAPPVSCKIGDTKDCVVKSAYGAFPDRSTCHVNEVVYPSSQDELLQVVANASSHGIKMRVVTSTSHSIPKFVCPDDNDGNHLLISTRNLDRVLRIDTDRMTVTVESGVTLRDLIDVAASKGLALRMSPYWDGVTVGGMLGTGARGSSLLGKGTHIHDYIVSMDIVVPSPPGMAALFTLNITHPDLDAARASLGLLGVISQITLQLEPMFKRSITNIMKTDADIENQIVDFGKAHEFGDLTWYPAQRNVVYRIDDRVALNERGDGVNDFIGFRATPTASLLAVRTKEETTEMLMMGQERCVTATLQSTGLQSSGYGLENNGGLFTRYPVVGFQNNLQASGSCLRSQNDALLTSCPWDPRVKGLFFHQTTMAISLEHVTTFIADIKRLRDMMPLSLCGVELYNGILSRFVKASTAYLSVDEDSLDFDITYYRSHDPMAPRLYEDVLEEIEQMGLFKYGGVPHWGKNRNIAFLGVRKKFKNFDKFKGAVAKYDPKGLFSNEWTDALMGVGGRDATIWRDGCALEGLCICTKDSHCAPRQHYYCRPGRIYKEARVCRYDNFLLPQQSPT